LGTWGSRHLSSHTLEGMGGGGEGRNGTRNQIIGTKVSKKNMRREKFDNTGGDIGTGVTIQNH